MGCETGQKCSICPENHQQAVINCQIKAINQREARHFLKMGVEMDLNDHYNKKIELFPKGAV